MAARKKTLHPVKVEEMRKKIRTTLLIKRLEEHSLVSLDEEGASKKLMSDSQVRAALGLLKKTIPDLSAVEHSGEVEHKHSLASLLKAL